MKVAKVMCKIRSRMFCDQFVVLCASRILAFNDGDTVVADTTAGVSAHDHKPLAKVAFIPPAPTGPLVQVDESTAS